MTLLRLRNAAAAAALPRLHSGTYFSPSAPCELLFAAYQQHGVSSSFLSKSSRRCSPSAVRSSERPRGVFAAATEAAVCRDPKIVQNLFASISTVQTRHSTTFLPCSLRGKCLRADNLPDVSGRVGLVGTSFFSSCVFLSEEGRAVSRCFSASRCVPDAAHFLARRCSPASPTSPKTNKTAALVRRVISWMETNTSQTRSICSSAADLPSDINSSARAVLSRASHTTQLATSSCSRRIASVAAPSFGFCMPPGSCHASSAAGDSAVMPCHKHIFRFLRLRESLSFGGAAVLCGRCELSGLLPAAALSLVPLSPLMPGSAVLAAPAPAAFASLSATVPFHLRTAAGATAGICSSSSFPDAFSAGAPLVGCRSSPPAPTVLAWETNSKRFLGARTRRQREEVERKAEQQRNSQLTAAQYPLNTTPQSSQHPYHQQVPPAGAAAGLSFGWQIAIAFISSIAFYFGFVMMMRLFGGHRVVAVHVDQYGRPVDPLTGQPR